MKERRYFQLFYFVYFAAGSGFASFRSAYLREVGFSGSEIGFIGFLIPVCGLVAQPIWGVLSDVWGVEKQLLIASVLVTGGVVLVYPLGIPAGIGLFALASATAVFAAFRAPVRPVANALVLSTGLDYGTVRAFGSIAFGVSILVAGSLVSALGTEIVFYVYAGGMAVVAALLWRVPDSESPPSTSLGVEAAELLRNRQFAALLVAAFLMGAMMSTSGSYFSIFMREVGGGDALTGVALALKTVAEALVFFYATRLSLPYRTLLVVGCLAHAVTFLAYAATGATPVVLAVQLLLGVGYASFYLAAVTVTAEVSPETLQSTAQTFLTAFGLGGGAAAGELLAGSLLDAFGVQSMYGYVSILGVVAAVASLGVVLPDGRDELGGDDELAS